MLPLVHSSDNQLVILNSIKHILKIFFNQMKNYNKAIYTVDDTNLNLIYYETNIKVKNYLNLLFQKNYPVINKPTRVSRNNATIIDHINTNVSSIMICILEL